MNSFIFLRLIKHEKDAPTLDSYTKFQTHTDPHQSNHQKLPKTSKYSAIILHINFSNHKMRTDDGSLYDQKQIYNAMEIIRYFEDRRKPWHDVAFSSCKRSFLFFPSRQIALSDGFEEILGAVGGRICANELWRLRCFFANRPHVMGGKQEARALLLYLLSKSFFLVDKLFFVD